MVFRSLLRKIRSLENTLYLLVFKEWVEEMKAKKGRRILQKFTSTFITVVCLLVFIYAAHGLIDAYLQYKKNDQIVKEVQEIYYQDREHLTASAEEGIDQGLIIRSGFEELLKINEDVIGWITIEDTKIDYPIMQSENNTDYLRTSFYGDYLLAGSLFLDYRNDLTTNEERNLIVYGHRVKDGSMFEHLTNYLDEDFYKSHRTFSFDTLYASYEAEVFAVYNTMIDFNYIETDFVGDAEYEQFLKDIQAKSLYEADINPGVNDQILTLSTCEYTLHPDDSRLVVHAILRKK